MAPSYIALALAAFFCVAQSASVPPFQVFNYEQIVKEFQTSINKSVAEIKKNLNLPENPDGAAIVKLIHEQSNKAEKTLADLKGKLDDAVKKNPEISEAFKSLEAKLDEGRVMLKKEDPKAAANLQKIVDAVKNVYESVGKEFTRVRTEVNKKGGFRDDFDGLLKLFIDRGVVVAKDFENKVNDIVKQVQA